MGGGENAGTATMAFFGENGDCSSSTRISSTKNSSSSSSPSLSTLSKTRQEVERGFAAGLVREVRKAEREVVVAVLANMQLPPANAFAEELERLPKLFPGLRLIYGNSMEDFTLRKEELQECEVLMWLPPGDATILPPMMKMGLLPRLRWLHSWFVGVEPLAPFFQHITTTGYVNQMVAVTNAKSAFSFSLAEWTFTAALYFEKDVGRLVKRKEEKRWDRFRMGELRDKTMGFVGFGDIAKTTARLAKAFGMRCIALRRRKIIGKEENELLDDVFVDNGDQKEKLKVFERSDFVVVTLPGTPLTRNFCGKAELTAMKSTAVFINVGRGTVVDENALAEALNEGLIRGAAVDVFHEEPLPENSPLWTAPRLLLSPHNADWVPSYAVDASKVFADNFLRFLDSAKTATEMATPVDLESGY